MSPAKRDQNRAIDEQIGRNVRALRLAAGMSQERLGEMLGITFQQVQKYEKGSNRISGSMLFRIAQVLNLPVGALFADIPGAASPEDQSGFDRLATAAERDKLRETIAAASLVLARSGVALDGRGGARFASIPAVHTSR